MEPNI